MHTLETGRHRMFHVSCKMTVALRPLIIFNIPSRSIGTKWFRDCWLTPKLSTAITCCSLVWTYGQSWIKHLPSMKYPIIGTNLSTTCQQFPKPGCKLSSYSITIHSQRILTHKFIHFSGLTLKISASFILLCLTSDRLCHFLPSSGSPVVQKSSSKPTEVHTVSKLLPYLSVFTFAYKTIHTPHYYF